MKKRQNQQRGNSERLHNERGQRYPAAMRITPLRLPNRIGENRILLR